MKHVLVCIAVIMLFLSCKEEKEHTAAEINPRDSVSMMTSYGVNTLISDSGVMKYRVIAEKWEVNTVRNPSRWIFVDGLFLEQYDDKFHTAAYIQCDTAYYFDQLRKWELRGRVSVKTADGLRFSSEELFWDQVSHELYSNKFSHLVTPDRELQGSFFRSDERMTHYFVSNTKGSFVKGDMMGSEADTIISAPDTAKQKVRMPATPSAKK